MPQDDSFFKASSSIIPACNRCRRRKVKCDTDRPACKRCLQAGQPCEYTDPKTGRNISRQYIKDLETQIEEIESLTRQQLLSQSSPVESFNQIPAGHSPLDHVLSHRPSPVGSNDAQSGQATSEGGRGDPGIVGLSSGIHLARSVLEAARLQSGNLDLEANEPQLPSSQHASQDQGTRPSPAVRPTFSTAEGLIEVFFTNCQVQYPILSRSTFTRDVRIFYEAPDQLNYDSQTKVRFCLNMVLAIALLFLSKDNSDASTLSENYNESAMQDLMVVMESKDLGTIQCLLLIFLYSLLHSTRAPMWYLSGLTMRMCVDLGLHSEDLIRSSENDRPVTEEQANAKRMLFWVTYTLDRTLSIILGRPLSMRDDAIHVTYPTGESDALVHKQIIQWIKLQRMQSEMVSHLYIATRSSNDYEISDPLNDWINSMMVKLQEWKTESMLYIDADGRSADWWAYWYHNALLLLLRPSLNNPSSSPTALQACYTATISIIQISFIQQYARAIDPTWLSVHHQFMAGITLLFSIWDSPEVRSKAISEWTTVKSCLVQCGIVLENLSKRWQSAKGAREVLQRLSSITIEALEKEMRSRLAGDVNRSDAAPATDVAETRETFATPRREGPPEDMTDFQTMFGEDLAKSLYTDPSAFYGFDNLGLFDDIDWTQTANALNFHGDQDDVDF